MRALVAADASIEGVGNIRTMYVGPNDLLVNLDVAFRSGVDAAGMHASIARVEAALKCAYPEVSNVYVEAASLAGVGGAPQPPSGEGA
jgi:divalent metal cation (Fe/Co/Zn/Cd) transporter